MLPKQRKLSRTSFPHNKDTRRLWDGNVLRIQMYLSNKRPLVAHFAVVVAGRLSNNAVMRNKFKRQVLVSIRKNLVLFDRLPYKKYVIFPKIHLQNINSGQVSGDIRSFFAAHKTQ